MTRWIPLLALLGMLLAGCGGGSEPEVALRYAEESCAACGMRVTAPRFASLAITPTGERRAYDSIECAVRDLRVSDPTLVGRIYLPDHDDAGHLHPWNEMFVVRADFPSPMGGGYAAFADRERAAAQAESRGGVMDGLDAFVAGTEGR